MKTGIELIEIERREQELKHRRSIEYDKTYNELKQLSGAAVELIKGGNNSSLPEGWNRELWNKMCKKTYEERLIIAGALIAAEIDRLHSEK